MSPQPEPDEPRTGPSREAPRSGVQRMGRAYQGAFEAVIAVAVGGVAGGVADRYFDTAPVLLMLGVLAGFGAFVLRMVRLMKELAPPPGPGPPPGAGS